jgi:hypothetical protein
MTTTATAMVAAPSAPMERQYFLTMLAYIYIDNHPDRICFRGSHPELLDWGVGMGLVTPKEREHYVPGNGTCRCCN